MKILFAVSNESISESIVKKYQKNYKEIISYKNVYYFNAILKEIERDKSYDRIVISEDLEPFANNNYETIDRFLFEKLDGISDEASNGEGADIPIILICTDRRAKGDSILLKLFSIGIYNAIIGQDRSIDEVCNLINKPRTKKDAKIYYKVESDDANYQAEDEDSVSEVEIQNILAHYKRLGKNTERYVDSFNNIASQYTDQQLKVIIKFLPLNVKAVLEAESPRYQEVVASTSGKKKKTAKAQVRVKQSSSANKKAPKLEDVKIDLLENIEDKLEPKSDVIIPSGINTNNVKKSIPKVSTAEEEDNDDEIKLNVSEEIAPAKKKRGRPKKVTTTEEKVEEEAPKRKRGRPKKTKEPEKVVEKTVEEPLDIDDLEEPNENKYKEEPEEFEEENEEIKPVDLFSLGEEDEEEQNEEIEEPMPKINAIANNSSISYSNTNIESLIAKDKKIVAFVGASKNGTSFLVNNLAVQLSESGINTAIIDVTKNKNSYYIYTNSKDNLRQIAINCIDNLKNGIAQGIPINKNLTVYTSLPNVEASSNDIEGILATVLEKHSLVLLDCDLETDVQYFTNSQQIFLVQSMDILTIQPVTSFLRDLKSKNAFDPKKLIIVLNKELKVGGLTPKAVIGGMSTYKDPAMTFKTDLFDRNSIKYCTIPFEVDNYAKYLDQLACCVISLKGYSKTFIASLKALSNLVYPLISRQPYQSTTVANNYGAKEKKSRGLFKFKK